MPGYAFTVTMTLTNPTNAEQIVNIPRGTILEPGKSYLASQSAVIAKDYIFRLNPKETRSVLLEAECWNQHLAPPQGTPGKLTPLKGNIQKTTNVWGTSSAPAPATISTKPSQPANVLAAFANTAPDLAYDFLKHAADEAAAAGANVSNVRSELATISSPAASKDRLIAVGRDPELGPYVGGAKIRQYFIQHGSATDDQINAVEALVRNVYTLTGHTLAASQYRVAMQLAELSKEKKFSVTAKERQELTELIRDKYITLVDSLRLLDQIEWTA
jgi:hypothetical protein